MTLLLSATVQFLFVAGKQSGVAEFSELRIHLHVFNNPSLLLMQFNIVFLADLGRFDINQSFALVELFQPDFVHAHAPNEWKLRTAC